MTLVEPGNQRAPVTGAVSPPLVGREGEQAALRVALDAARAGTSAALLIRGGRGMGKTALLRAARTEANDLRQLSVTGLEAETIYPYAALHRLLIPVLDEAEDLPAHHGQALDVAFGRSLGPPPDRYLIAVAVLGLLSHACETVPLLCTVDDLQWLDAESAEVLSLVARRLHADAIALFFATRAPATGATPLADLSPIDLLALSHEHSRSLVHAAAPRAVDPIVVERIVTACGGCPLAIIESCRSLTPAQLSGGAMLPVLLAADAGEALQVEHDTHWSTPVDELLVGMSLRITVEVEAAKGRLRHAADMMRSGELSASRGTSWLLLGQTAVLELWDPDAYRETLLHLERRQRGRGELDGLRVTLLGLCRSETWAGNFAAADAHRLEARSLALLIDGPGDSADLWSALGMELLAWQGRTTEARAAAARLAGGDCRSIGAGAAESIGWLGLVTLELGLGRYGDAVEAGRQLFDGDVPPDATLVLPDLVESAVRSGDVDVAHAAMDRLSERAGSSGTDWALGLLARSRALLERGDDAEAQFDEAVARLGRTAVRTDLARARLLYGEWLRREKRKRAAREQLAAAHELFAGMGAAAFAERARIELEATGAQARRRSAEHDRDLTPQESQIARLAANGDTNAEIAERLYISPRTVDYHLRKVYRKAGVASRRELRRKLDGDR